MYLSFVQEKIILQIMLKVLAWSSRKHKLAGTPCIGTRTGGIPDAIDKGNGGWLIKQDDQNALSDLLISLISDKSLLKKQSELALYRVNTTCNWSLYFKDLKQILSKIIT